jgi:hypothetical protein
MCGNLSSAMMDNAVRVRQIGRVPPAASGGKVIVKRFSFILSAATLLVATIGGQAALRVDFSRTGLPVQPGFQGYFADHEVGASFTTQSFSAFGVTVSVGATP